MASSDSSSESDLETDNVALNMDKDSNTDNILNRCGQVQQLHRPLPSVNICLDITMENEAHCFGFLGDLADLMTKTDKLPEDDILARWVVDTPLTTYEPAELWGMLEELTGFTSKLMLECTNSMPQMAAWDLTDEKRMKEFIALLLHVAIVRHNR